MTGTEVTPESLTAAATAIVEALGAREVGRPPMPVSGAAYGHDGLGGVVVDFGSAVQLASGLLVGAAERASAGLREGAAAYAAREQANFAQLLGISGLLPGGS